MSNKGYIIVMDTLCQGWTDYGQEVYETEEDADREVFEDAHAWITEKNNDGTSVEDEVDYETHANAMSDIAMRGNVKEMNAYLCQHEEANYNQLFVVPAEEFTAGRKAIWNITYAKTS